MSLLIEWIAEDIDARRRSELEPMLAAVHSMQIEIKELISRRDNQERLLTMLRAFSITDAQVVHITPIIGNWNE